jgi:hypothetical protein
MNRKESNSFQNPSSRTGILRCIKLAKIRSEEIWKE